MNPVRTRGDGPLLATPAAKHPCVGPGRSIGTLNATVAGYSRFGTGRDGARPDEGRSDSVGRSTGAGKSVGAGRLRVGRGVGVETRGATVGRLGVVVRTLGVETLGRTTRGSTVGADRMVGAVVRTVGVETLGRTARGSMLGAERIALGIVGRTVGWLGRITGWLTCGRAG
jgi:hypothetical protein